MTLPVGRSSRHAIDASAGCIGPQGIEPSAGDLGDLKVMVGRYADGPQILGDVVLLLEQGPDGFAAVGRFQPDVVERERRDVFRDPGGRVTGKHDVARC